MEPPSRGEFGNESAKKLTAIHNRTKHMDDVYLVGHVKTGDTG